MDEKQKKAIAKAQKEAEKYGHFQLWEALYVLDLLRSGNESVTVEEFGHVSGLLVTLPVDESNLDGEWAPHFLTFSAEWLLNQEDSASELGIDVKTIQRWQQGKNSVSSLKIGRKRFYRHTDLIAHAKRLGHKYDWRTGKISATNALLYR